MKNIVGSKFVLSVYVAAKETTVFSEAAQFFVSTIIDRAYAQSRVHVDTRHYRRVSWKSLLRSPYARRCTVVESP